MKRIIFAVVVLLVWPSMSFGKDAYKIGGMWAITGPAAALGDEEYKAALLWEEQVNSRGGINGHPVKLIIYDTEGSEPKAVMATKKLLNKDKVPIIVGPTRSGPSFACIPIIQAAEVVNITNGASHLLITPVEKRQWIFRTVQGFKQIIGQTLAYWQAQMPQIKRIATITSRGLYADSFLEMFVPAAEERGYEIVAQEKHGYEDTDMTSQLVKIRSANPDLIQGMTVGPTSAIVVKNMKQLGMETPIFYGYDIATHEWLDLAGDAGIGTYIVVPKVLVAEKLPEADPQKELCLNFKNAFNKKWGKMPSTFANLSYGALMIIEKALSETGPDSKALRDYIENNIKDFPILDGNITYSPTDHDGMNPRDLMVVEVVKGGWRLADGWEKVYPYK
jgi:branched-chain amino acid transport system substrate-binding protein